MSVVPITLRVLTFRTAVEFKILVVLRNHYTETVTDVGYDMGIVSL